MIESMEMHADRWDEWVSGHYSKGHIGFGASHPIGTDTPTDIIDKHMADIAEFTAKSTGRELVDVRWCRERDAMHDQDMIEVRAWAELDASDTQADG